MASSSTSVTTTVSASNPTIHPVQDALKKICTKHDKKWFSGRDQERFTYATIAKKLNRKMGIHKKREDCRFTAVHIYDTIRASWVEDEDAPEEQDLYGRKE